ncbi:hypothetical protein IWQ56_002300 [Coemansia nantahalensis]|uniref:Uncharacterized protein n=1 Tax=Coemansia nantahalensis TaxID=2789366 RepID=A0ACC1K650_9FUNG|nr:hypothetical protein IWQ56_002300 [Coemansia nantahalensis]KAJ2774346.1 hypothetical protein IWQ57_000867 [Coemansia nantahalensis]
MQLFATLLVAASAVMAQQIGSDQGTTVSSGPSAISNPNVNNGQQFQNSLVSAGSKGGNVFEGLTGNTFVDSASNMGMSDNNMINPAHTSVQGNSGATANGEGNFIGDMFQGGFMRRDAVFNNFGAAGYPHGFVHNGFPVVGAGYAHPGFVHAGYPMAVAQPMYARPYPVAAPVAYPVAAPVAHAAYPVAAPVAHAAYPVAGHVNHNVQSASIVQNQA